MPSKINRIKKIIKNWINSISDYDREKIEEESALKSNNKSQPYGPKTKIWLLLQKILNYSWLRDLLTSQQFFIIHGTRLWRHFLTICYTWVKFQVYSGDLCLLDLILLDWVDWQIFDYRHGAAASFKVELRLILEIYCSIFVYLKEFREILAKFIKFYEIQRSKLIFSI